METKVVPTRTEPQSKRSNVRRRGRYSCRPLHLPVLPVFRRTWFSYYFTRGLVEWLDSYGSQHGLSLGSRTCPRFRYQSTGTGWLSTSGDTRRTRWSSIRRGRVSRGCSVFRQHHIWSDVSGREVRGRW